MQINLTVDKTHRDAHKLTYARTSRQQGKLVRRY